MNAKRGQIELLHGEDKGFANLCHRIRPSPDLQTILNFINSISMGKFNKGILGSFSGKVGNVVGASWRGITYMRSLPSGMRNPRTEKQLTQRNKFSLVGKFLKTITPVVRVGFKNVAAATNSAYSAAMSYNIQNALRGEYPDIELDYERVAISRGSLYAANSMLVNSESGKLEFLWDATLLNNTSTEDRVMVVAYNPSKGEASYDLNLATRADGTGLLEVPLTWEGNVVETFAAFVSEDGSQVSDTIYTGQVEISMG